MVKCFKFSKREARILRDELNEIIKGKKVDLVKYPLFYEFYKELDDYCVSVI